jgi:VanZ family protein
MKMTVAPAPHLRRIGLAITITTLSLIAFATLLPGTPGPAESPFCVLCGSFGAVDVILNIILFIPLGVGLALTGVSGRRALLAMCALSAIIETAQLLFIPGRDATLRDVLTNTLGGAVGLALARHATLLLRPPPRIARRLALGWATIWLVIQAVSNFGFAVTLPSSHYYGQIGRLLGSFELFPGKVLNATVGNVRLPNTVLEESRTVQSLLMDGAALAATVIPGKPTRKIAPIVRIADETRKEIVLLGQDGDLLVYSIRTGASVLRLRPPVFGLPGAFPLRGPDASSGDSLSVSGSYTPIAVGLDSRRQSDNRDNRIRHAASLGWTLWLPFQWLIEGTLAERVVSWLWVAFLMIPLGYWAIQTKDRSGSLRAGGHWSTKVLAVSVAFLSAGFILVPYLFGLPPATIDGWIAAFAGFIFGLGLGGFAGRLSAAT